MADHLELVHGNLHHHHTAEDDLLWPKLLQRVPEELAPLVHLMEQQHATVEALLDEIAQVLPRWRSRRRARSIVPALADLHDRLYVHLVEHMDAEEERLLPIASRNVSQDEWEEMGAAARSGTPRSRSLLVLGHDRVRRGPGARRPHARRGPCSGALAAAPVAGRVYRRHARAVYGTPSP